MKKVENLNQIASIIKSDELSSSRLGFAKKYSLDPSLVNSSFNSSFGKWIKGDVDIRGFVDLVIKSNPSFNIDEFSIFDLIIDYLKIHLYPIKDLIDENPDDVINVALNIRDNYIDSELYIGSKENSPELSDDIYNPFDKPELIIDEIINVLEVKFSNNEYRERFYDVCIKFIKNIRNKIQTFEILIRAKKDNGVGLNRNIADEILNKIEKIKKQAEESLLEYHKNNNGVTQNIVPLPDEIKNLSDLDIDKEDNLEHPRLQENSLNKKKDIIEEYVEGDMKFHVFDGSVEEMYLNQIKNKEEISDMNVAADFMKKFENVKLIGPIEELAFFTIKDFRNLDQDVEKRAFKIENKIKVLSSYSARKRVLGIKAWLASEVCSVYKKMIDESVKYGDVGKVINIRKENADLYLTQEEIDAIAQLNRKLRI